MAKRPTTSQDAPPRQRKRWRNGVSTSTQVLDSGNPPPPPPLADVMRVWRRDAHNLEVVRESNTPIPKPHDSPTPERTVQFQVTDMLQNVAQRPKRKNRNNSVRPILTQYSTHF